MFGDILLQGAYFFGDDVPAWDDKAFAKRVHAGALDKLAAYRDWLAAARRVRRARRSSRRRRRGSSSAAGRSATSSTRCVSPSPASPADPGLFDCLALLGRDVCVRRIDRALEKAGA